MFCPVYDFSSDLDWYRFAEGRKGRNVDALRMKATAPLSTRSSMSVPQILQRRCFSGVIPGRVAVWITPIEVVSLTAGDDVRVECCELCRELVADPACLDFGRLMRWFWFDPWWCLDTWPDWQTLAKCPIFPHLLHVRSRAGHAGSFLSAWPVFPQL